MKSSLRRVDRHGTTYDALMFACPGCAATREGYEGLHMLPVNVPAGVDIGQPSWSWDGNLEAPTLDPSILTRFHWGGVDHVCHSYLRAGVFEFLGDCTHPLVGQHVPIPDLPAWAAE